MDTVKNTLKASAPIVVGVVLAGLLMYFAGNLPVVKQAKAGFNS